jgi:hypothetical protein
MVVDTAQVPHHRFARVNLPFKEEGMLQLCQLLVPLLVLFAYHHLNPRAPSSVHLATRETLECVQDCCS